MEEQSAVASPDVTDSDRLWAALSWLPISPVYPILAIVALVLDDTKDRPFVRYHAVMALAMCVATILLTIVTLGFGAIVFLVNFYWAYKAYQGEEVTIPVVTDFCRNRGWI